MALFRIVKSRANVQKEELTGKGLEVTSGNAVVVLDELNNMCLCDVSGHQYL